MIKVKPNDKMLENDLEVMKHIKMIEKVVNELFPEKKLQQMREEMNFDMNIYGIHIRDGDGNRVDPVDFFKPESSSKSQPAKKFRSF